MARPIWFQPCRICSLAHYLSSALAIIEPHNKPRRRQMPQLPSGRRIAIDVKPVRDLIDQWLDESASSTLARIRSAKDLYQFVRVVELTPALDQASVPVELREESDLLPGHFVDQEIGLRLSDWPDGFAGWTEPDRLAFQAFLDNRVPAYLESVFVTVKTELAKRTRAFLDLVEETWRRHGIHPDQEPGWADLPETPQLDEFDAIVALMQCRQALLSHSASAGAFETALYRLTPFLQQACSTFKGLVEVLDPLANTQELASTLRAEMEAAAIWAAERRAWWRAQSFVECGCLFDNAAVESVLLDSAPKAWGVVRAVTAMLPVSGRPKTA